MKEYSQSIHLVQFYLGTILETIRSLVHFSFRYQRADWMRDMSDRISDFQQPKCQKLL